MDFDIENPIVKLALSSLGVDIDLIKRKIPSAKVDDIIAKLSSVLPLNRVEIKSLTQMLVLCHMINAPVLEIRDYIYSSELVAKFPLLLVIKDWFDIIEQELIPLNIPVLLDGVKIINKVGR